MATRRFHRVSVALLGAAAGLALLLIGRGAFAQSECPGDCNSSTFVTVDELLTGIGIALGDLDLNDCPDFDLDDSNAVEVDELVAGVDSLISGCGPVPSPSPTGTGPTATITPTGTPCATTTPCPTDTSRVCSDPEECICVCATITRTATGTPTPTLTPITAPTAPPVARFAGATTAVVNAIGVIPNIVAAIATGIELGGAGASLDDGGVAAAACPGGGTATRTGTIFPGLNLNVQLAQCNVPTVDGSVTFDGSIVQTGAAINVNVTAAFEDSGGNPTNTVDAMFTANVALLPPPSLGGPCAIMSFTITIANGGTITTTTSTGQSASATFQNTSVNVSNLVSSDPNSCVLVSYRLTFNGNAALVAANAAPIQVTFNMLRMDVDDSSDPALFTLSGGITSPCFGGAVTVTTQQALSVLNDELCPRAGQITAGNAEIFYRSNQNVDIDTDGDGQVDPPTYPNCLDPRLYQCLA